MRSGTFLQKRQPAVTNMDVPHRSRGQELCTHTVLHTGFTIQERVPGAQGDADQAHPHAAAGVRYIPMTVLLRGEVQSDGTSASSQKEKQKVSKCKLRLQ